MSAQALIDTYQVSPYDPWDLGVRDSLAKQTLSALELSEEALLELVDLGDSRHRRVVIRHIRSTESYHQPRLQARLQVIAAEDPDFWVRQDAARCVTDHALLMELLEKDPVIRPQVAEVTRDSAWLAELARSPDAATVEIRNAVRRLLQLNADAELEHLRKLGGPAAAWIQHFELQGAD